ncbi:PE-PGRS family protein [Amycolatopsis sp. NPDC058340]|uniref:PPE domain-containing protein n=1 Tax=Amycolatopsis sp. NPDC058340 TaxID=3346453 RepID=UPI00365EB05C
MPEGETPGREVPVAATRYEAYSHEALAAEVEAGNDPEAAGGIGAGWDALARRMQDATAELAGLVGSSEENWRGEAGDALRGVLATASGWLTWSADLSSSLGKAVSGQAEAAARARADMPPPVDYDPGAMIRGAAAGGNLALLAALADEMEAKHAEAEEARRKAVDVMNTRDASLRSLTPRVSFGKPPELGRS